ncbi:Outer membrane protein OprM [Candidatus Protochlamydia amoebophila]|uniref:efflux transporter outer membrane subunit n=1 Tax=Candidatus Protochlamydia amoebophila TaxID=362787 RepID=UPI001BCA06E6|nr:efflux transporter outer membrane subunit [Candidatus Protochlamydia amoebophila]MBS4162832.1 Outer membrane protein OprM [Candidatus Protochlamydia amoebophila]
MQYIKFFIFFTLNRFLILLLICVSFQSCRLIAPYQAPLITTPQVWKNASKMSTPEKWEKGSVNEDPSNLSEEETSSFDQEQRFEQSKKDLNYWWEIFDDSILNKLEEQALELNHTLGAAFERVIQSRAIARIDRASLFPTVNFSPSYARSGMLQKNALGNAISSSQQNNPQDAMFSNLPQAVRGIQSQYFLSFDFNYELDLWSKLTNTYESAIFRSQASTQAYLSILLTLTADIASNYFQLRDLDSQQAILQRTIEARQKAFDINQARFNAGLIVYSDVSRAKVELARARSDLANIQRLRSLQENIIATLTGTPATVFSIKFNPINALPPSIPAGLPSELLYRRPDIAEAERNLAASYAEIGIAYASFFPTMNLNAGFGLESPFVHSLISWKARLWEIGLNLIQTVFDGGRNCANLAFTKSRFRETLANYQENVLMAFQDVEDSLVNLRQKALQAEALEAGVKAARETLKLSQMRYKRGLINYLDVVDAERTLLETEQNSVIVLGERYNSTIRLIKALGGGWNTQFCTPKCWETD